MNIGRETTRGLGAGGTPAVGEQAAEESRAEIARGGVDVFSREFLVFFP